MLQLKDQGIFAVGTLHQDRLRGCKLSREKDMRNSGRGTIHQVTEKNGLAVCVWFDNRRVITISNFIGKYPISYAKQYDGKEKKMVQIPRPSSVQIYNRFMGGVDKADMLLSLYRTKLRSRKWYHRGRSSSLIINMIFEIRDLDPKLKTWADLVSELQCAQFL